MWAGWPLIILGIVLAAAIGRSVAVVINGDDDAGRGTTLCSDQKYAAGDRYAKDIGLVMKGLVEMDSDVLPTIDVNVYSPNHYNPVAYGQRICTDEQKLAPVCEACFDVAQKRLVDECQSCYKAGGQITLDKCFMRYEIYEFVTPKP